MTSMTTKLYGAAIGTGLFFALGTAMANASEFAWFW
jgi:amino acid permease